MEGICFKRPQLQKEYRYIQLLRTKFRSLIAATYMNYPALNSTQIACKASIRQFIANEKCALSSNIAEARVAIMMS